MSEQYYVKNTENTHQNNDITAEKYITNVLCMLELPLQLKQQLTGQHDNSLFTVKCMLSSVVPRFNLVVRVKQSVSILMCRHSIHALCTAHTG